MRLWVLHTRRPIGAIHESNASTTHEHLNHHYPCNRHTCVATTIRCTTFDIDRRPMHRVQRMCQLDLVLIACSCRDEKSKPQPKFANIWLISAAASVLTLPFWLMLRENVVPTVLPLISSGST